MSDFGVSSITSVTELTDDRLQFFWDQYCRNRTPAMISLIPKSKGEQDRRGRELYNELKRRGLKK
jgi:hypothetical protein